MPRVNANIEGEAYLALQILSERKGKNKTEVLKELLTLGKYLSDEKLRGCKILILDTKGNYKEMLGW